MLSRIKQLADEQGTTLATLEKTCHFGNGTIKRWGEQSPSINKVIELAKVLNVSLQYLALGYDNCTSLDIEAQKIFELFSKLDERGKTIVTAATYHELDRLMESKKKKQGKIINFKTIEPINQKQEDTATRSFVVYDMPASAGTGLFLDSTDYQQVDLPQEVIPAKANFAVKISGDSMLPKISDGDIVFVNQTPSLENGDIGIITLNGSAYCKRLIYKNDYTYLESLNKEYAPIELKEGDDLRVVGKVVGVGKHLER